MVVCLFIDEPVRQKPVLFFLVQRVQAMFFIYSTYEKKPIILLKKSKCNVLM